MSKRLTPETRRLRAMLAALQPPAEAPARTYLPRGRVASGKPTNPGAIKPHPEGWHYSKDRHGRTWRVRLDYHGACVAWCEIGGRYAVFSATSRKRLSYRLRNIVLDLAAYYGPAPDWVK